MVAPLTGLYTKRDFKSMLKNTGHGDGGVCSDDVVATALVQYRHTASGMMAAIVAIADSEGMLFDASGRRFSLEDESVDSVQSIYIKRTPEDTGMTLESGKLYLLEVGSGQMEVALPQTPNVGDSVVMVCYSSYGSQTVNLLGNGNLIMGSASYDGMLAGQKYEFVFTGDPLVGWATCQAM